LEFPEAKCKKWRPLFAQDDVLGVAVDAIEILEGHFEAFDEVFFPFPEPNAWIVILFVWLFRTLWIAELRLEIRFILFVILLNTFPVGPLHIGIDVHFYGAIADGFADLVLRASASAVEDEVDRLGPCFQFFCDIVLAIFQDDRAELDIARAVDAVYIAKGGGYAKKPAYLTEFGIGEGYVFGLCIEFMVLYATVIDPIFFAAGHTQLDLDGHAQGLHAFEEFYGGVDIFGYRLLGEIQHMGAVKWLLLLFEKLFAGVDESADPGEPFFGGMIRVHYDWDAVIFGYVVDVEGARDAAGDIPLQLIIGHTLAGDELGAAVGELDDNGRIYLRGRFQHGIDGVGADGVDGGQCKMIVFCVFVQGFQFFAEEDAGFVFTHSAANIRHGRLILEFAEVFLQQDQILLEGLF
jgi:hypothetical protein